jgi:phage host-nuclease inhibitor protein Gam
MATKVKAPARAAAVPQSKEECAAYIASLGDAQREFERQRAAMNDGIAAITVQYQPTLEAFTDQIKRLQAGIQDWCETNRVALLGEGPRAGKTANLVTGEVAWRQRPPSVRVRNEPEVIDTLERMGLGERYVRNKPEVNKEAILAEPAPVRGIAGLTIVSGVEDFIVTPFEVKAEVV